MNKLIEREKLKDKLADVKEQKAKLFVCDEASPSNRCADVSVRVHGGKDSCMSDKEFKPQYPSRSRGEKVLQMSQLPFVINAPFVAHSAAALSLTTPSFRSTSAQGATS